MCPRSAAVQGSLDDCLGIASDLIELDQLRPAVDQQWRISSSGVITHPYPGDGGEHLLDLAVSRANNISAVARSAVTATAGYTGDTDPASLMADLNRAWVEGSTVHRFDWANTRADHDIVTLVRTARSIPGKPSEKRSPKQRSSPTPGILTHRLGLC